MITNIRYILITALRDWLFIGLFAGVLLAAGVAAMLGSTAFLEGKEMTLTFTAGASRLILMVGMIVFVCFHIRGAFDSKEIDVILSRPITRANLVLSYWLGFALVATLLALPVAGLLALLGVINVAGFALWTASLLLEIYLVVALALFSAFTLRSAVTSVIACMGFYVLSRMMAFFVMTAQSGMVGNDPWVRVMKPVLTAISSLVPRLDFFGKSEWLVYGLAAAAEWQRFVLQAAVFIPFLLLAAIADFRRRQF